MDPRLRRHLHAGVTGSGPHICEGTSTAPTCAPCRSESDDLDSIHAQLQERGLGTVLGINVRDYNPQISLDFLEDNGLEYPSIYDPPFKTAAALGGVPTSVVPTTIVLDKQHRPAAVFLREITEKDVMEVVDRLEQE